MSSRPVRSQEIFESQEAAFVENYDWLIRWSLHFTHNDRARAEDLVQEVFAQLAFAYTDLSAVHDVRGYLYTTLKNTHLSTIRLAGRSHDHTQSIVEYSVAAAALGASDPYSQYQAQDELRRVCQYACARKQSSRAGGVLILRYFMGYHVSEVALVLGASSQAVRQSLRFARNEARLFLDDPAALKFIDADQKVNLEFPGGVCAAGELLANLRLAIFRSCRGDCLASASFRDLYVQGQIAAADNSMLAHIVSCPRCLDSANRELGLPLLSERHPADALGPDNSWRGGGGQGGGGGLTGNAVRLLRRVRARDKEISRAFLLQCQRRAQEIFEHYPSELRVSVNGYVLGSQAVNSETSRLRLDIPIAEPLSFVEVMGEENARLLVMTVDPPPAGEPVQSRRVGLSEGRYLEATLRHGHPWPMLEVVYHDPTFNTETQIIAAERDGVLVTPPDVSESRNERTAARLLNFLRDVELFHRPFWSRPGFITGAISLLLISALSFVYFNLTWPITATSLLERASAAESLPTGASQLAVHRVINLEERRVGGGLIARNRIEIWRDLGRNVSARRVYDDTGRLIAGEWLAVDAKAKQSRTIYHHGLSPRVEAPVRNLQDIIRNLELWRLEPLAQDYAEIIGQDDGARVSEDSDTYVINYDLPTAGEHTLLQATLILRKSDLHAVGQVLTLRLGNETREYRLVEASFERPSIRAVAPATLAIDPELLSRGVAREDVAVKEGNGLSSRSSSSPSIRPSVAASPELEVEVAYLLDQFRTRFGDQLSLTKSSEGALNVQGVVENEEARSEILQALSPVLHNPAVRVEIVTAKEALARLERQRSNPVIPRDSAESDSGIPAYADLHRYFSRPGTLRAESSASGDLSADDAVDQAVRVFAARVVGHSRRALSHAVELKRLSGRFSETELASLSPSARATWSIMVRNHAEALRREISLLCGELQPIFFANEGQFAEGIESRGDADLAAAIAHVHRLVLANDEVIRSGFAASSGGSTSQAVKTPRFWVSLVTTERLAESVLRLAEKN